jgi:hypothetical protein
MVVVHAIPESRWVIFCHIACLLPTVQAKVLVLFNVGVHLARVGLQIGA